MTEKQGLLNTLPLTTESEKQLSRRQFLKGTAVGGAAGLAVAAGTGVAVWTVADAELQATVVAADAEIARATVVAADAEIARLEGLVALYEDLEKVGLDAILTTGMQALSLPLAALESGAQALKSGLEWAEEALLTIQEALPSAEESLLWLEARVSTVAEGLESLETALGTALDKAIRTPLGEAVTDFSDMLLSHMPFGWGDKIRDVLAELAHLLTSVDELVAGLNTSLLEPLRERWFSTEEGLGVGATFLTPLVENQVRQQIARYKQEHGFL